MRYIFVIVTVSYYADLPRNFRVGQRGETLAKTARDILISGRVSFDLATRRITCSRRSNRPLFHLLPCSLLLDLSSTTTATQNVTPCPSRISRTSAVLPPPAREPVKSGNAFRFSWTTSGFRLVLRPSSFSAQHGSIFDSVPGV
jgi:hypothetical protein